MNLRIDDQNWIYDRRFEKELQQYKALYQGGSLNQFPENSLKNEFVR